MKRKLIVLMVCIQGLMAAQHRVTGIVADQLDGTPLRGVTLTSDNAGIQAVTDAKGNFSFSTTNSVLGLNLYKKGFSLRKIKVQLPLKEPLTLLLSGSVVDIEEVTLSTGYQKIAKERSTGSFSTVGKDRLEKQVTTGIIERIANIANSVTIDRGTSGEPQLSSAASVPSTDLKLP